MKITHNVAHRQMGLDSKFEVLKVELIRNSHFDVRSLARCFRILLLQRLARFDLGLDAALPRGTIFDTSANQIHDYPRL
jgi:hypothetical protein